MNWYERMNKAINYIEVNLTGQIDFDVISKIICQSAVNFQQTFSIVTDITVNEYIRRRRMTLTAFKEIHGISTMAARKEGIQLRSYSCLTFLLIVT